MNIGSKVDRIEGRAITGATVLAIEGDSVLIEYDEGGQGWWPLTALRETGATTKPVAVL